MSIETNLGEGADIIRETLAKFTNEEALMVSAVTKPTKEDIMNLRKGFMMIKEAIRSIKTTEVESSLATFTANFLLYKMASLAMEAMDPQKPGYSSDYPGKMEKEVWEVFDTILELLRPWLADANRCDGSNTPTGK